MNVFRKPRFVLGVLLAVLSCVTLASIKIQSSVVTPTIGGKEEQQVKGVWFNYMEYGQLINGKTKEGFTSAAQEVVDTLSRLGFNTLFLHLRSHSDSFYPSERFPWSVFVNGGEGVDYDPTEIFITLAHDKGIRVHAWVNPYRITRNGQEKLNENSPAYALREDGNCVVSLETGMYYNPSSPKVRALVLDGVREILECYDVDGVQYDDYFYPTTDPSFDQTAFQQYCEQTQSPMSLNEWRRCQVNLLISGTYQLTRPYEVAFGVSPSADLEKNANTLYADVTAWVEGGYVDYLCPQLYFGFEYPAESFRFSHLLDRWQSVAGDVPLYIGLASYKVGKEDAGSTEWVTATDLLARQTEHAFLRGADGVCVYHYTSLLRRDEVSTAQRNTLQQVLLG